MTIFDVVQVAPICKVATSLKADASVSSELLKCSLHVHVRVLGHRAVNSVFTDLRTKSIVVSGLIHEWGKNWLQWHNVCVNQILV
jgi:hypothetical protein